MTLPPIHSTYNHLLHALLFSKFHAWGLLLCILLCKTTRTRLKGQSVDTITWKVKGHMGVFACTSREKQLNLVEAIHAPMNGLRIKMKLCKLIIVTSMFPIMSSQEN